jgi:hypothetical protein
MPGVATGNQSKACSRAGDIVMTRSKRETEESKRGAIAQDRAYGYLHENHHDNAPEIAMRVMYRLALTWSVEQDIRRRRKDPTKVFVVSDDYVRRVHNMVAELRPASQSDALAEHYVLTLLAEFNPDRNDVTRPPYPFI